MNYKILLAGTNENQKKLMKSITEELKEQVSNTQGVKGEPDYLTLKINNQQVSIQRTPQPFNMFKSFVNDDVTLVIGTDLEQTGKTIDDKKAIVTNKLGQLAYMTFTKKNAKQLPNDILKQIEKIELEAAKLKAMNRNFFNP